MRWNQMSTPMLRQWWADAQEDQRQWRARFEALAARTFAPVAHAPGPAILTVRAGGTVEPELPPWRAHTARRLRQGTTALQRWAWWWLGWLTALWNLLERLIGVWVQWSPGVLPT